MGRRRKIRRVKIRCSCSNPNCISNQAFISSQNGQFKNAQQETKVSSLPKPQELSTNKSEKSEAAVDELPNGNCDLSEVVHENGALPVLTKAESKRERGSNQGTASLLNEKLDPVAPAENLGPLNGSLEIPSSQTAPDPQKPEQTSEVNLVLRRKLIENGSEDFLSSAVSLTPKKAESKSPEAESKKCKKKQSIGRETLNLISLLSRPLVQSGGETTEPVPMKRRSREFGGFCVVCEGFVANIVAHCTTQHTNMVMDIGKVLGVDVSVPEGTGQGELARCDKSPPCKGVFYAKRTRSHKCSLTRTPAKPDGKGNHYCLMCEILFEDRASLDAHWHADHLMNNIYFVTNVRGLETLHPENMNLDQDLEFCTLICQIFNFATRQSRLTCGKDDDYHIEGC